MNQTVKAQRFPPALLDEIRARLRISDVVGSKVTWDTRKSQPAKGDHWACCPFHDDKTPSFHVDDHKGRYHCFGCKEKGDIFAFVRKAEGLSFPEAVEHLADLSGVSLPSSERPGRTNGAGVSPRPSAKANGSSAPSPAPAKPVLAKGEYPLRTPTEVDPRTGRETPWFAPGDLPKQRNELHRYEYERADGEVAKVKIRLDRKSDPKHLPWYHVTDPANGQAGWQNAKPDGYQDVPFGLLRLLDSDTSSDPIFFVEGEKDAKRLQGEGQIAVTFGGAGDIPDGTETHFENRDVVVFGDNDAAGHNHCETVARALFGTAKSVTALQIQKSEGETPDKYDLSDWFDDGGSIDDLFDVVERTKPWRPKPLKFNLETFNDIQADLDGEWLVKGVLPRTGVGMMYGASRSGKSFFALDGSCSIAQAKDWGGRKISAPGGVVYIAAEGQGGFRKRVLAYREAHGLETTPLPFGLISQAPNMGNVDGDAEVLIADIETLAPTLGAPIRLVVIDTLAQTMYGADENSATEMQTFLTNVKAVANHFNCFALFNHHPGKDDTKGARGSSALTPAIDVEIEVVDSDGLRTATIHKQKDAEADLTAQFQLSQYVLGVDSDGDEVTSCLVEMTADWALPSGGKKPRKKLTDLQKFALGVVREALMESGQDAPNAPEFPRGVKVVNRDVIKGIAAQRGFGDETGNKQDPGREFNRALRDLITKGEIACVDPLFWTCEQ